MYNANTKQIAEHQTNIHQTRTKRKKETKIYGHLFEGHRVHEFQVHSISLPMVINCYTDVSNYHKAGKVILDII